MQELPAHHPTFSLPAASLGTRAMGGQDYCKEFENYQQEYANYNKSALQDGSVNTHQ